MHTNMCMYVHPYIHARQINAGANCEDGNKFAPETPGSSPYVTAVGGTQVHNEKSCDLVVNKYINTILITMCLYGSMSQIYMYI